MNKKLFKLMLTSQLPIAWIAGLRLKSYTEERAEIKVSLNLLNQNPFKSMFWAVQGMAAEFSTGILCVNKIQETGKDISMLVVGLKADFTKKAVGKIVFSCEQGKEIEEVIAKALETGEGQVLKLISRGKDEAGDQVAQFEFTWSFKVR